MNTISINGRRYIAKEMTFGAVRQFESNGLSLTDISQKPMSLAAAYLAYCAGISIDAADNEIQEHIIKGGTIDGIFEAVMGAMNESRFFQALNKRGEEKVEEEVPQTSAVAVEMTPLTTNVDQ